MAWASLPLSLVSEMRSICTVKAHSLVLSIASRRTLTDVIPENSPAEIQMLHGGGQANSLLATNTSVVMSLPDTTYRV